MELLAVRKPGARALPLHLALALGAGALLDTVPLVEHALQARDRLRRVPGDRRRHVQRLLLGGRGGSHRVHDAPPQRLLGPDILPRQQEILRHREPAQGDQPGRSHRYPKRRSGKAHAQVRPPHPKVAGHGDLRPPADAGSVAGGDGGLREGGQLVIEAGEQLHAAHPALGVEDLANVGSGGEAHVVARGEDEDARVGILAGGRQVPEELFEHLGVDRVAGLGAVEAQQGDPGPVQVVGREAHSIASPSFSASSARISWMRRSASSAACRIRSRTSLSGSAKRERTYSETISGSVESGRPTPMRTRQKPGPPRPWATLFTPLCPASPPPSRVRTSPNGRSISSWIPPPPSSGTLRAPRAGPAEVPDSFM